MNEHLFPIDPFENEDEENGLFNPALLENVSLYSTDWTADTIVAQLVKGNIDINPRFQRRDAWDLRKKSRFIESLIYSLPVPQIVLAERKDQRGQFIVLDGKQRLLTLLQFWGKSKVEKYNYFRLRGLDYPKYLNDRNYNDLEKPDFIKYLNCLQNQSIRTVIVRGWEDFEVLEVIFLRLNTTSTALSPQELRLALYPGGFVDYVYDVSEKMTVLQSILGIEEPDYRMRDVEYLIRFIAFQLHLSGYAGDFRDFLNSTCDTLNDRWLIDENQILVKQLISEFEKALETIVLLFGLEYAGRKWNDRKYNPRTNKALMDVLLYYFSDVRIRSAALSRKEELVCRFKTLCEEDSDFVSSIERTTQTMKAVSTRFAVWGDVLREVLEIHVPSISLDASDNRIHVE